jgi:hypothetical protein
VVAPWPDSQRCHRRSGQWSNVAWSEIRIDARVPKAYFSAAGLTALRLLALDRRYMDPQKFAHVRAELGLEATMEGPVSDT